ncbi:SAM-dependent methyltransferase [Nocardiopsis sediminis]|uniref:SAM-dependent methyltransferase n=1 Tax=Nocardiopsis sediminis TaxID=1778267 RepID=A0ABV8FQE6_9ACTN
MSEHGHDAARPAPQRYGERFWDGFYEADDRVWSGNANAALVRETAGLEPGRALDLGCGEGGDAIWLARSGWRVTAADISGVALERGARHAAEAGVGDRIDWQRHDLAESVPEGSFDLVSAHFLHAHGDGGFPRERVLRAGAQAVAPGGVLLVVGHAAPPSWAPGHRPDVPFPPAEEVLAGLELAEGRWEVLVCGAYERSQNGPDGRPGTHTDSVVKVRRRPDEA